MGWILWTVMLAFTTITFLTIVVIWHIKPFCKYVKVKPRFEDKLFWCLIVEIIVLCLNGAGASLHSINKDRVSDVKEELKLSLGAWETASRIWMSEPSGLSLSGLHDSSNPCKLLVAVDDEESAVFIIDTQHDGFPLVRAELPLSDGKGPLVEDLEAITYDGTQSYYALASHRLLGDEDKAKRSRKLVKFEIDQDKYLDSKYKLRTESIDLTTDPDPVLGKFLAGHGVDPNNWDTEGNDPHKYGLELEGMAYHGSHLYIGLKWPLDSNNNALLISYAHLTKRFDGIWRLDLEDKKGTRHGISALAIRGGSI